MEGDILRLSELSAIQKIEGFPKEYADEVKYLFIQEMKLVLSQPDTSKRLGIRDKFFMYLLYDSGCRVQEILGLKVRSFFIKNGGVQLHVVGKGNKFRATPISNELLEMFKEYCAHYHRNASQDDYLFYTMRNGIPIKMSSDNVQRFVEKYGTKARSQMPSIPHIHPHLFRHTFATLSLENGMDVKTLSAMLDHVSAATTPMSPIRCKRRRRPESTAGWATRWRRRSRQMDR